MTYIEIIILAIALAIDALIVSFAYGLSIETNRIKEQLKLSLSFGFFQALMPLIGFYITNVFFERIEIYSKWIIFIIFLTLGIKFLKEGFEEDKKKKIICISFSCLMWLSIATSIDAMAAGIYIRLTNTNLFLSILTIGVVTFILSATSFESTKLFKKIPSKAITIIGALLLFFIAIKNIT